MSQESWVIIGTGLVMLWGLGATLRDIHARLGDIANLLHRIRIQDHERDF